MNGNAKVVPDIDMSLGFMVQSSCLLDHGDLDGSTARKVGMHEPSSRLLQHYLLHCVGKRLLVQPASGPSLLTVTFSKR